MEPKSVDKFVQQSLMVKLVTRRINIRSIKRMEIIMKLQNIAFASVVLMTLAAGASMH